MAFLRCSLAVIVFHGSPRPLNIESHWVHSCGQGMSISIIPNYTHILTHIDKVMHIQLIHFYAYAIKN